MWKLADHNRNQVFAPYASRGVLAKVSTEMRTRARAGV
jgi:hypothetical protein